MNFPQIFGILTGILGNSFKVLQNSALPQDSESAELGILHKLLLSFLEILKVLDAQFSVVHGGRGGGERIFSGIAQYLRKGKNVKSFIDPLSETSQTGP